MNEKTKEGVLTLLLGWVFFFFPFVLREDPDIIATASIVALFSFGGIILMVTGWSIIKGKKTNQERIAELEKKVETLEER